MEKDKAKIEESFKLLDKMVEKFNKLETKRAPCIGDCNDDCRTLELTRTRVTNFYINNV